LIERFLRPPGGVWGAYGEARGIDATLILESLGLQIPLSDIYHGINFEPGAA
jgi:hypothetical protein